MKQQWVNLAAEISKVDEEQRIVYATLLTPEQVDLQGHVVSLSVIQRAAINYMREWQVIGEGHTTEAKAQPVESWVGYGAYGDLYGWNIGVYVADDKLWAKIQDGTYKGMSIGGLAMLEPEGQTPWMRIVELAVMETSFVDVPAVPSAVTRFYKSAKSDSEDKETLVSQIEGGKVKPRVRAIKAACHGIQCSIMNLARMLKGMPETEALAALTNTDSTLAEGESENTAEVTDMNREEVQQMLDTALAPVTEQLAALGKKFEGMEAQAAEAAKAAEDAASTLATTEPDPAIADLQKSVAELVEQGKSTAEQLAKIAAAPAQSMVLKGDGEGGEGGQKYSWKK